jgi:hypothetical protein
LRGGRTGANCRARDTGKEGEMAAYVIASVDVQDAAVFEEYRRRTIEPKALRMKSALTDAVLVEGV